MDGGWKARPRESALSGLGDTAAVAPPSVAQRSSSVCVDCFFSITCWVRLVCSGGCAGRGSGAGGPGQGAFRRLGKSPQVEAPSPPYIEGREWERFGDAEEEQVVKGALIHAVEASFVAMQQIEGSAIRRDRESRRRDGQADPFLSSLRSDLPVSASRWPRRDGGAK